MSTKIVEASRVVNWASVNILLTTRDLCCNYFGTPRDNVPCFPCFVRSCFNLLLRSPRNFHWTCETQCSLTLCIIKGAVSRTWMFSCSLRNAVSDCLRNDVLTVSAEIGWHRCSEMEPRVSLWLRYQISDTNRTHCCISHRSLRWSVHLTSILSILPLAIERGILA